jgi:hypothetical protein
MLDFSFCFSFLQDIVRKKMSELLILDLHNLAFDAIKTMNSSRSFQIISERQAENTGGIGVYFIHYSVCLGAVSSIFLFQNFCYS